MRTLLHVCLCLLCFSIAQVSLAGTPPVKHEYVVLIHGLAGHSTNFWMIKGYLKKKGYTVISFDYPSLLDSPDRFTKNLHKKLMAKCTEKDWKINFVGHSMGGIIIRLYLEEYPVKNLGRVVMVGTPNKGSEHADLVKKFPWLAHVVPAAPELTTSGEKSPLMLPPVDFDLGIIAGNKSVIGLSDNIPGEDDGMVSVESTKVDGMKDFIKIPADHVWLLVHKETLKQIGLFLETGAFDQPRK
jgi:triacylglycerol lipase